jgi:hypothetical protein
MDALVQHLVRRHGIKVTFEGRTARDLPVIFVCFGT